jgi:hypothetical protein
MDQVYDIDGVGLLSDGNGGHMFQLELRLGSERYSLATWSYRPDIDWILMHIHLGISLVDPEDEYEVLETHVSFSLAPFHAVAQYGPSLVLTDPPLGEMRVREIRVRATSDPYLLALAVELDGGLILTCDRGSSWTLTDGTGTVLHTAARFEADVFLPKPSGAPQLVIREELARGRDGDIRELGAAKQWEALPRLLLRLQTRPTGKRYNRAVSEALAELTRALKADLVSSEDWELLAWNPSAAIHRFDDCWLRLLPAFQAILTFGELGRDVNGVVGDWLADKDDPRATDVLAAGFEANRGQRKIALRLSRSLVKAGDPRVLSYLLDEIDPVGRDIEPFEIVLTKAARQCDVAILRRIADLRAFVRELVDVAPENETQTGENLTYSGNLLEVDTSKVRGLALAELRRRGIHQLS